MKSCAFAGVLLAVFCVSGVAEAGDGAAYKAPLPPSGAATPGMYYAGLSFGGRWSDTDWSTATIGSPPSAPQFGPANPASFDSSTARIGGYAGSMWRIAPQWAVGIEGDVAWGDSGKTIAAIPGTCCGLASVREGWDGSIRGRFGFLLTPAWLVYGTGGIAWQGLDVDASCGAGKGGFCSSARTERVSTAQTGWTLGTGIEVMLRRNWLIRLEYRFADYGHLDHTFFGAAPADRVVMTESLKTQTLLLGFAYKLGAETPIAAGY